MAKDTQPQEVNLFHLHDDVDVDEFSHHHTLGEQQGQAAPGLKTFQRLLALGKRIDAIPPPTPPYVPPSPNAKHDVATREDGVYSAKALAINNSQGSNYSTNLEFTNSLYGGTSPSNFAYTAGGAAGDKIRLLKDGLYSVRAILTVVSMATTEYCYVNMQVGGLGGGYGGSSSVYYQDLKYGNGNSSTLQPTQLEVTIPTARYQANTDFYWIAAFYNTGVARSSTPNKPSVRGFTFSITKVNES